MRKYNPICERLVEIQGDKSGKKFADSLEISQSTLYYYLKGRIPPSDFVAQVCDKYNVNANWLLTGEGPKNRNGVSQRWDKPEGVQTFGHTKRSTGDDEKDVYTGIDATTWSQQPPSTPRGEGRGEGEYPKAEKKPAGDKLKEPPSPEYGKTNTEVELLISEVYRIYYRGDEIARAKLRTMLAALDPGELI